MGRQGSCYQIKNGREIHLYIPNEFMLGTLSFRMRFVNLRESEFKDFEVAVQCYSAINAKADCLITRNKGDYITATLPILAPEEFLAAIAV